MKRKAKITPRKRKYTKRAARWQVEAIMESTPPVVPSVKFIQRPDPDNHGIRRHVTELTFTIDSDLFSVLSGDRSFIFDTDTEYSQRAAGISDRRSRQPRQAHHRDAAMSYRQNL